MGRYIFILGTNWRLSLAEINNIIEKEPYNGRIVDYSASAAIVEFDREIVNDPNLEWLMFQLGGTQKIGYMVDFIEMRTFFGAFPEEVTSSTSIQGKQRKYISNILKDATYPIFGKIDKTVKYFIANSVYGVTFQKPYYKILVQHFLPFVNKEWVKILKNKKAKNALYYRYPEDKIRKGTLNPIFPHHFYAYKLYQDHRKEILYAMTEEGVYIGYTINVTNSNETKKIDERRPYKDPKSSIPPKFAKIMIQLLKLNKPYAGNRILDPFCGSGTILMFAHSLGIQTFGLDVEKERILGARKNLKWISKLLENPRKTPSQNYKIGDIDQLSTHFENKKFDGIISEPFLLPYYRELPHYNDLVPIIENTVIPKYKSLFSEGYKVLKKNHRIVVTVPSVETLDGGRFRLDIESIAKEHDFISVPIYGEKYIAEKSDQDLLLYADNNSLYDDKSEVIRRVFHVFEKIKED